MATDLYSKLSSMKSSRRRVANPSELEEEENYVPDFSGIANQNEAALPPPMEAPINTEGNDIRANTVIEPQEPEGNIYHRIGQKLGMVARESGESGAAPMEGTPTEAQEPQEGGIFSKIGRGIKNYVQGGFERGIGNIKKDLGSIQEGIGQNREQIARNLIEMERKSPDLNLQSQQYAEANAPNLIAEQAAEKEAKQQALNEAQQNPLEREVYGSADEISKRPELQTEIKRITGIDWSPVVDEQVKKYEMIMSQIDQNLADVSAGYSDELKSIRQRIDNNQATDQDKYYIGLALLLPLIVGGAFGAEAGLATLAGSVQGLGNVYDKKQKQIGEDQERLAQISKQKAATEIERGDLQLKRSQIPEQIRKNLPSSGIEHLEGRNSVSWVDPATGERKEGVEILPGLVAEPQFVSDKESLKNLAKSAKDIQEVKNYTEELNELTQDVLTIASQLKDKNILSKMFTSYILGKAPTGALSRLTEDVDFEGRRVNAGQILDQKLGFLANAYAQAKNLGQLDRAAQAHIDRIITNPTKNLATTQDLINQMLETRKLAQSGLLRSAKNAGFSPEILANEMGKKNREVYGKLNQKENRKAADEIIDQVKEF